MPSVVCLPSHSSDLTFETKFTVMSSFCKASHFWRF